MICSNFWWNILHAVGLSVTGMYSKWLIYRYGPHVFVVKLAAEVFFFEDLRTTGHQNHALPYLVCVCVPHGFKLWLYVPCIPTPHSGFISNNFCSSCWVCSPKCSDNFGRNPPTMVQTLRLVVCSLSKNWYWKGLLPRKLTWLAGKSTRNEDVFPYFQWGIFQLVVLVFRGVLENLSIESRLG